MKGVPTIYTMKLDYSILRMHHLINRRFQMHFDSNTSFKGYYERIQTNQISNKRCVQWNTNVEGLEDSERRHVIIGAIDNYWVF